MINARITKRCSKCRTIKDGSCFSPQKQMKMGLASWCKECKKNLEQSRRVERGIKIRIIPKICNKSKKECLWCHEVLSLENFIKSGRGREGRASYCKQCSKIYHRQDKFKALHRKATAAYRKRHGARYLFIHRCCQARRKAAKRNLDSGLVTKGFLLKLYNQTICGYCHKETIKTKRTMDHVIPLSKGGWHHPDNLVMACVGCNSAKKDKDLQEFLNDRRQNNS